MPKQTFFNLNEEKRKNIERAITNEFSKVSIEELSISRIVEEAKIPRGSFYQYFEDKEDAIKYIIEKYIQIEHKKIEQFLKETNGDIFEGAIKIFDHIIEMTLDTKNMKLYKNILEELRKNNINIFENNNNIKNENNIFQMIDTQKLNIEKEEDLKCIMRILNTVTRTTSMEVITNNISKEKGREILIKELEILKYGMLKGWQ